MEGLGHASSEIDKFSSARQQQAGGHATEDMKDHPAAKLKENKSFATADHSKRVFGVIDPLRMMPAEGDGSLNLTPTRAHLKGAYKAAAVADKKAKKLRRASDKARGELIQAEAYAADKKQKADEMHMAAAQAEIELEAANHAVQAYNMSGPSTITKGVEHIMVKSPSSLARNSSRSHRQNSSAILGQVFGRSSAHAEDSTDEDFGPAVPPKDDASNVQPGPRAISRRPSENHPRPSNTCDQDLVAVPYTETEPGTTPNTAHVTEKIEKRKSRSFFNFGGFKKDKPIFENSESKDTDHITPLVGKLRTRTVSDGVTVDMVDNDQARKQPVPTLPMPKPSAPIAKHKPNPSISSGVAEANQDEVPVSVNSNDAAISTMSGVDRSEHLPSMDAIYEHVADRAVGGKVHFLDTRSGSGTINPNSALREIEAAADARKNTYAEELVKHRDV